MGWFVELDAGLLTGFAGMFMLPIGVVVAVFAAASVAAPLPIAVGTADGFTGSVADGDEP